MTSLDYIYLHGFASSPSSTKAQYLQDRFGEHHISLGVPNLNQGDFSHLTLTRQLQQVAAIFPTSPTSITIVGSSFGGLTAAWLGEKYFQVQRLVLLAPAFRLPDLWLDKLTEAEVKEWQESGYMLVYHYGEKRSLPLHYQFMVDINQYRDSQLQRPVPTLILHGRYDEVVPIECSRDYTSQRPWVELIELESDHTLTDVMPQIWQAIQRFCCLT